MPILAIDTSMAACSVAVFFPERGHLVRRLEAMPRGHAEALFPMIEAVMSEAGCGFAALTRLAVSVGPGSFTGVRAGVAAGRGLALAAGKPLIGVGTLEIMAQGAMRDLPASAAGGFAVVCDARRDELYLQIFGGNGEPASEPLVLCPDQALPRLPSGVSMVAGSGAGLLAEFAAKAGVRLDAQLLGLMPDAADLARIAADRQAALSSRCRCQAPSGQVPCPRRMRPAYASRRSLPSTRTLLPLCMPVASREAGAPMISNASRRRTIASGWWFGRGRWSSLRGL
jgi:tRNA threonylcarbamoyladenosine biosynthesis protein TsaB